jgi:hypothetical protein
MFKSRNSHDREALQEISAPWNRTCMYLIPLSTVSDSVELDRNGRYKNA